jgi:MFS transporter, PPP family, 3-phenylpropionic acid transporter
MIGEAVPPSPVARLRALYFLYYGNVGTVLPFFAVYLQGLGFSGKQIGIIQMLPSFPLAPMVAISWAMFADHRATPQRALRLATGWVALAVLLLPLARTPWQVALVVVLMALGDRAVVPLTDSVTIEYCRDRPGVSYARIRLFGSLGFVALTVAVGRLLTLRGGRPADLLVPLTVVACVAGYALVARGLPATPSHGARPAPREMLALLRDRRLWLLLGPAALHWAACAPYHVFFGVLVRDLGLPDDVTSAGMSIGVGAEIVALLAFPWLERRFPLRRLFAIAAVGSAIRWALLARATHPAAVAGLQVFHGLDFGLFWGSAMHALAGVVPPRLRATGQAVFTGVVFGGANAIGYALSGIGYDRFGSAGPLFSWAAGLELVAAAVLLAAAPRAPAGAVPSAGP